jgi:hypothetical protein
MSLYAKVPLKIKGFLKETPRLIAPIPKSCLSNKKAGGNTTGHIFLI